MAATAGAGLGRTEAGRRAAATEPARRRTNWPSGPNASSNAGTRWFGLAAVAVGAAITFSPPSFLGYFTVFVLAVFVGFYVISNVTASLHTPLMAQTNAISGIILVGALLQLGSTNIVVVVLAFIAATVASINIFGGFGVAGRMIAMFRKDA